MLIKLFVLPLILHVLMVLVIGLRTLSSRIKAVRSGQAKLHEVATDNGAWPRHAKQLGDNFSNQFETPTMWYAITAIALAMQLVDVVLLGLTWMFLLTRLAHSYVHVGNNNVPSRMRIFLFGFFILVAMWLWFGLKLFLTR
jgi:hypothetical protein